VPTLELTSVVRFHDEDSQAYNVIAEIPGRAAGGAYVMAGAHLDSWAASDGAADNAAGSVAVMEAARILAKLGARPRRGIRFALWAAEEQGTAGSIAYVERHVAHRPPVTNPDWTRWRAPHYTWNARWPITPLPGHEQLVAYFNVDHGSGKVRGIYTEGNVATVPIFRKWLAPFASMGVDMVAAQRTPETDHVVMHDVGIPAFQFIQDPLDYYNRLHHTSVDSYDHLRVADLKQVAVILASLLWMAAQSEEPMPRMPLPREPADSNPFAYGGPDDE
jgi:carboxypeptidase Q